MATLTLKQLPPPLLERLREDARRERRSLNQHAIHLLEAALESRRPNFGEALEQFRGAHGPPEEDVAEAFEGLRSKEKGRKVVL